jgi:hypothetical protein
MPILALEPFVYPEDLFAASESAVAGDCRWWVLHTRPRAEKAAWVEDMTTTGNIVQPKR